ncbi:MAG TPA: DNA polymerase Y family protein [Kofleriaceae bacterium]|nr:DNA polymerase Y family protein [Kofleriaceae bacterium]
MDRVACALVPRFELALRARMEPGLWARPVAVTDLTGPGRLGVVTPAAEVLGVRPGQLAVSARARCPELEVMAPDPEMVAAAEQEILRVLGALSPRLDSDRRGGFFLGLAGLERIAPSESGFAAGVRAALGGIGLAAQVAVADRPFSAWVAARRARPVKIVAPGRDQALLAGIPLSDLPLSDPAHELIALFGLDSAAQLAALPAGELARRLGEEGAELERLLGGGGRPFAWPREEMVPVEAERSALELEEPIEDLEPLLFLGKSLVDRILAAVAASRRVVAELSVVARLDDRSEVTHVLRPAEPTLEARPILDLFRLWLENRPFAAPVLALEMTATGARPASARQLSLYHQREEQEAAALARAVARLGAAFGASCAVRPVLADSFRPEARLAWVGFEETGSRARSGSGSGTPMVMRMMAPEPVDWDGDLLRRSGQAARVVSVDGPVRLCGEWWGGAGFDRSYFWITLADGSLFWIYRDHRDGRHYLQGVAD